jgi:hypothetical protein
VLFILDANKEKWFKKYKSLSCSPEFCTSCKTEPWKNGKFEFWISQRHVGYARTCSKCSEQQTLGTPKSVKEQQSLNRTIRSLTKQFDEKG